jgi:hypothetical protein
VLNDGGRSLSEDGGRRSTEVDGERKTVTEVKYDTTLSRRVRILTWRQEEIEDSDDGAMRRQSTLIIN